MGSWKVCFKHFLFWGFLLVSESDFSKDLARIFDPEGPKTGDSCQVALLKQPCSDHIGSMSSFFSKSFEQFRGSNLFQELSPKAFSEVLWGSKKPRLGNYLNSKMSKTFVEIWTADVLRNSSETPKKDSWRWHHLHSSRHRLPLSSCWLHRSVRPVAERKWNCLPKLRGFLKKLLGLGTGTVRHVLEIFVGCLKDDLKKQKLVGSTRWQNNMKWDLRSSTWDQNILLKSWGKLFQRKPWAFPPSKNM